MLAFTALLLLSGINDVCLSKVDNLVDLSTPDPCDVGDTVQNGRVTCACTQNHVYECALKKPGLPSLERLKQGDTQNRTCQPNKIYVQETTTCVCNRGGYWPHSVCGEIFDSLPASTVIKSNCEPDGYVIVDCNVCRCNSEGTVDTERCTKNECNDNSQSNRRSRKSNDVYGNCEAKNWYSLAPCQFCYCINENKLVCNTGNYFTKKLQLGTYNLNVCGKDLIREAIELIPDTDTLLRHGWHKEPKDLPKPKNSKTSDFPTENNDVVIEVNRHWDSPTNTDNQESSESKKESNDKEEDSNDESEENKMAKVSPRIVVTTQQIPYHEDYSKETAESLEKEENTDNEIETAQSGLKIPAIQREGHSGYEKKPKKSSTRVNERIPHAKYSTGRDKNSRDKPPPGSDRTPAMLSFVQKKERIQPSAAFADMPEVDSEFGKNNEEGPSSGYRYSTSEPTSSVNGNDNYMPEIGDEENLMIPPEELSRMGTFMQLGKQLKQNLPLVLSKVFSMALRRKAMVTINKETTCTPGDIKVVQCNTCFCLKNSKLLCTNNKCE